MGLEADDRICNQLVDYPTTCTERQQPKPMYIIMREALNQTVQLHPLIRKLFRDHASPCAACKVQSLRSRHIKPRVTTNSRPAFLPTLKYGQATSHCLIPPKPLCVCGFLFSFSTGGLVKQATQPQGWVSLHLSCNSSSPWPWCRCCYTFCCKVSHL